MRKERSTIYDIAKRLDITPSTVSRALSNHPRISERTKQAVRKMAAELNYQHNGIAAALRSGKTHILGVMVPTANRSFFASVVRGIEQVANRAGYNVMITQSNDSEEIERSNIEALMKTQVDGIIASIAKETTRFDHFLRIKQKDIPLILFDRINEELLTSAIVVDDYLGAYQATEHLIGQGCRRIAHFAGQQHINIYKNRTEGYRAALRAHGLPIDPALIIESNQEVENGRENMRRLLQLPRLPDAVFSASDWAAIGAMQILKAEGFDIPGQMALVGFANEPFTSFVEPALTTVDQHSEKMGQIAADLFLAEVLAKDKDGIARKTVLAPQLITRASSLKRTAKTENKTE